MIDGRFESGFAKIFAAAQGNDAHSDPRSPALAALFAAALGVAGFFSMWAIG